eukprot:7937719-Lingulodinium_polyedra.AAC.1
MPRGSVASVWPVAVRVPRPLPKPLGTVPKKARPRVMALPVPVPTEAPVSKKERGRLLSPVPKRRLSKPFPP